jgi:hypothetical protein
MKRALCLLLMVWIALQSALVQAHFVQESLHQLGHSVQLGGESVVSAEQDEPCSAVVCSHPSGVFQSGVEHYWGQHSAVRPYTVVPLESAHVADDIERPKWPVAAPGVASI